MHKCEGEEEALVRSDLLGLSSKSGAQVNFLWETSSQVVENQFGTGTDNLNKKKTHIRTPNSYNLVRIPFRFKTILSRDKFKGMRQNLDHKRIHQWKKIVAQ